MAKGSFKKKKSAQQEPQGPSRDFPPAKKPLGPSPAPAGPSQPFGINKKDKSSVGPSIFEV